MDAGNGGSFGVGVSEPGPLFVPDPVRSNLHVAHHLRGFPRDANNCVEGDGLHVAVDELYLHPEPVVLNESVS